MKVEANRDVVGAGPAISLSSSAARLRKRKTKIETTAERIVTMPRRYGWLAKITSLSQACGNFE
jgi:hypothetical protein